MHAVFPSRISPARNQQGLTSSSSAIACPTSLERPDDFMSCKLRFMGCRRSSADSSMLRVRIISSLLGNVPCTEHPGLMSHGRCRSLCSRCRPAILNSLRACLSSPSQIDPGYHIAAVPEPFGPTSWQVKPQVCNGHLYVQVYSSDAGQKSCSKQRCREHGHSRVHCSTMRIKRCWMQWPKGGYRCSADDAQYCCFQ